MSKTSIATKEQIITYFRAIQAADFLYKFAVDPLFFSCHQWLKHYMMTADTWFNHCPWPVQMANKLYIMSFRLPSFRSISKGARPIQKMYDVLFCVCSFCICSFCISITCRSTQIKTYSWDNAQVVLAGNKCDMEEERVVSVDSGRLLAEQLGESYSTPPALCCCYYIKFNFLVPNCTVCHIWG